MEHSSGRRQLLTTHRRRTVSILSDPMMYFHAKTVILYPIWDCCLRLSTRMTVSRVTEEIMIESMEGVAFPKNASTVIRRIRGAMPYSIMPNDLVDLPWWVPTKSFPARTVTGSLISASCSHLPIRTSASHAISRRTTTIMGELDFRQPVLTVMMLRHGLIRHSNTLSLRVASILSALTKCSVVKIVTPPRTSVYCFQQQIRMTV